MNVILVSGYGDRADYLKHASRHWPARYGSNPIIVTFGWSGGADSYDEKWEKFSDTISNVGDCAIVGISAGASVAFRAMQTFPDQVSRVVSVCGPVHPELMNQEKLHKDYPLLEHSLGKLTLESLPAKQIMTLRPLYDEVVPTGSMVIDGAHNVRMKTVGHAASIAWGVYRRAGDIHNFINDR